LNNWVKYAQMNRVMEGESHQLREVLDKLSQGQLSSIPASPSSLPTGGALVSAGYLQRQLGLHFAHLRDTLNQVSRSWNTTTRGVQNLHYMLQGQGTSVGQQEARALQETLAQVERELEGSQALIQMLWRDTSMYTQGPDGRGGSAHRASDGLLLGEP
jgi:hypothetical protein